MLTRIKAGEKLALINPLSPAGEGDIAFAISGEGSALRKSSKQLFELEAGARLELTQVLFAKENLSQNYEIRFLAEEASCELNFLDLAKSSAKLETAVKVIHQAPNCKSEQLHKGLYSENSQGFLKALIEMPEGAINSDASQLHRSLLLGKDARSYAEPHLNIQIDEVKCQHGVSIGQLDEKALFYLQARCLSLKAAKQILIEAFAAEVLNKISDKCLRESLSKQVFEWI